MTYLVSIPNYPTQPQVDFFVVILALPRDSPTFIN